MGVEYAVELVVVEEDAEAGGDAGEDGAADIVAEEDADIVAADAGTAAVDGIAAGFAVVPALRIETHMLPMHKDMGSGM